MLLSPTLWCLCVMYFCMSYAWYFNIYYLPTYLEQQHGVTKDEWVGQLYKGAPLILGAAACLLGGLLTDRYVRRTGDRRWGRRFFGMLGHALCIPCCLACVVAPSGLDVRPGHRLGGLFQRPGDGAGLGGLSGRGQEARSHRGRLHEHGRQPRWGGLGLDDRGAARLDARRLRRPARSRPGRCWAADLKAAELPGYQTNFLICACLYGVALLLWLGIDATKPVLPEDAEAGVPANR